MVLSLLAMVVFQQHTGELILEKIASKIEAAKTISVEFRFIAEEHRRDTSERIEGPGKAYLRASNKVTRSFLMPKGGVDEQVKIVSDGKHLTIGRDGKFNPPIVVNGKHTSKLRVIWSRLGIVGPPTLAITPWFLLAGSLESHVLRTCSIRNAKAGVDENGNPIVTYSMEAVTPDKGVGSITVWYDPKSFLAKKRTIQYRVGTRRGKYTEIYTKWVIDADIPDEKFKLPDPK